MTTFYDVHRLEQAVAAGLEREAAAAATIARLQAERDQLRSLLGDACDELRVLASYVDAPIEWPSAGLKLTAMAQKALLGRIKAAALEVPR